jgi:hypothetical protein
MPVSDPGAARRFLDDKVAQSGPFQYDAAKAPKWVLKVRNYVVGVYPELTQLLKWAEDQQHREIKAAEIGALKNSLLLDMDPVLLSQRLWSWIQLCLKDDDNMELAFNNVEPLNGLEFWRKLVVPQYARTPARRYRLRDLVQTPKGANSFVGTEQALVVWDKDRGRRSRAFHVEDASDTLPGDVGQSTCREYSG